MKLKILSVVFLLIFIFIGCGSENLNITSENAVEKFNNAVESLFNSDSYTISAKTNMNVSMEDKTNSGAIEVSAEIKSKSDLNKNKIAEFKGIFNLNGESQNSGGYFKDGFFYNSEKYTSEKNKIKIDYSQVLTEGNANIFKLTDNSIISEPIIDNIGNDVKVDFNLNVAALQQEIPDFIPKLTYFLRVSEYDFTMISCKISSSIGNDGNFKYCNFIVKAKNTLYDGTSDADFKSFDVDCDININIDISDINNTDFDIPDDLDSYIDVTPENNSGTDYEKTS